MTIRAAAPLRARVAVFAALTVFLLLVLPTWQASQIPLDTLDGGYRAVLNDESMENLEFGTDLVTTTGPLGFLRNRDYWPGRFESKLAWDLGITLCFLAVFWLTLERRSTAASLLFISALIAAFTLVRFDIFRLTNCLPVLYVAARLATPGKAQRAASAVTVVGLAIGAWVLFTNLVLFTAVVVVTESLLVVRTRRLPSFALAYAALLAVVWTGTGNKPGTLLPYLRNSLEVAGGYPDVMLRPGGFLELLPSVIAFGVLAIVILGAPHRARLPMLQRMFIVAATGGIFFVTYRSAFVRFEETRGLELSVVVALMALLAAMETSRKPETRRFAALSIISYALALGGGIGLIVSSEKMEPARQLRFAARHPQAQVGALVSLLRHPERQQIRFERSVAGMRKRFPLAHIEGPVDMQGNLQGIVIANGLDYRPRPVFQSFTAYTPRLIRINSDYVSSARAPEQVIVELRRALGYPEGLLDAGAWLELLTAFEPVQVIEGGFDSPPDGLLIAKRAPRRRPLTLTEISSGTYDFGSRIEIPEKWVGAPIWAVVEDDQTMLGTIGKQIFKLPPMFIDLDLKDGKHWTFKFTTAPARSGFLLSPQVRSVQEIEALMNSGLELAPSRRVVVALAIRQAGGFFSPRVRRSVHVTLSALVPDGEVGISAGDKGSVPTGGSPGP